MASGSQVSLLVFESYTDMLCWSVHTNHKLLTLFSSFKYFVKSTRKYFMNWMWMLLWNDCCYLSLLQAVDPSGKGSATRVLLLHSARFSASTLSCRSSMLCLTTSIHLFLCLPLLRCPPTFASKIRLTQSSFSRRCTCPYHLSLASRTLSMIHATPRIRRMSYDCCYGVW